MKENTIQYNPEAPRQTESQKQTAPVYILGIESSCDDTSAAVISDGYLLSNVLASQDVHKAYGGVIPELASRAHQLNIVPVVSEAITRAGIAPEDITEDIISSHIYTKHYPDPELIIRPSGEYRLSNFLIWQAAYSEFWFSDILWPDFTEEDFDKAIIEYCRRNRRFGGV